MEWKITFASARASKVQHGASMEMVYENIRSDREMRRSLLDIGQFRRAGTGAGE
jgi:hypothetical protein